MNTNEILTKARAVIEKPENWVPGIIDNGKGAYCALGAIYHASKSGSFQAIRSLSEVLGDGLPYDDYNHQQAPDLADANYQEHYERVAAFNNMRGHECMLAAFDAAIEVTAA
jgi:hypothetical protein